METQAFTPEISRQKTQLRVESASVASERHFGRNEDRVFANKEKQIFGVFDGMGGYENGDRAAEIGKYQLEMDSKMVFGGMNDEKAVKFLTQSLQAANQTINGEKILNREMGSTATVGVICEQDSQKKLIVANLGDSRAYLHRDGKLSQITVDDNWISYKFGYSDQSINLQNKFNNVNNPNTELNGYEQVLFEKRNGISAHLGLETVNPKIYGVDLKSGDKILFCSDGISDNLTDKQIEEIMGNKSDESNNLINKAKEIMRDKNIPRSKSDDASAIVIEVDAKEAEKKPREMAGFTVGEDVNVMRSNGQIDNDFRILNFTPFGEAIVMKPNENPEKTITKIIKTEELKKFNKNVNAISEAENYPDLLRYLKSIDGIQGSSQFYTSKELLDIVGGVKNGIYDANAITRTDGLRDTVRKFEAEKKKN